MRATEILDAKYEKANLKDIALSNKTLNKDQKLKLFRLLKRHKTLFDGTLGNFNDGEIDMTLKPGVTPFRGRPYPIPHAQKDLMRREVDRLVQLGVLEGPLKDIPEWGAPCFPIPKKNNQIRFITDLRGLNARTKRNHFPLPKIQELIHSIGQFTYATSLDLNSGYYTIRLTPNAQNICTIILPWGSYRYKRMPMGVAIATDIFQHLMSKLMQDLEFCRVYLALIGICPIEWDIRDFRNFHKKTLMPFSANYFSI